MQSILRALNKHRVTAMQLAILVFCEQKAGGSASISELAEELCTSPANASGLVDRLEADKGWIKRTHSDADRRVVLVKLSSDGMEVLAQVLKTADS